MLLRPAIGSLGWRLQVKGRTTILEPRLATGRVGNTETMSIDGTAHYCRWVALAILVPLCGLLTENGNVRAATLYEQRQQYRAAVDHLHAGHISAARNIQDQLAGYPLEPYLTYHRLRLRLSRLAPEEVHQFRRDHPDIPGAHRIYRQWLVRLATNRQWRTFLAHYEPVAEDESLATELRCHRMRALYNTGRKEEALDGIAPLWTVGKSQPKACDLMFGVWQSARLDPERAWQRLRLAIDGNQLLLARYLQRFFEGNYKPWAQSYYNVHVNPASIAKTSRFSTDTAISREVIAHGLRRLAARDATAAHEAWARYRDSHRFSADEQRLLNAEIEIGLAREGLLAKAPPTDGVPAGADRFADAYLEQRNWPLLLAWIEKLPDEQRFEEKWQYWLARALAITHQSSERARLAYQALAGKRSYYGFLAANRIGQEPQLNAAQRVDDAAAIEKVRQLPGIARAAELFAVGDDVNARREWMAMLPRLTPREQGITANLARDMGQLALAIRTANETGQRDHLEARFPVDHAVIFRQASRATGIPVSTLAAFARQESFFERRARSTANARGVMQMLHSTARFAARRAGMRSPTVEDLYDPTINIPLGGHHLAWLLKRYDQTLPLVAAAYNAGEGRVDRWMKDAAGQPMDAWIESIPFRETRNYVKNVLSFNLVYSRLLGKPLPMLRAHETVVPPR